MIKKKIGWYLRWMYYLLKNYVENMQIKNIVMLNSLDDIFSRVLYEKYVKYYMRYIVMIFQIKIYMMNIVLKIVMVFNIE